jgi:hypothetical protein
MFSPVSGRHIRLVAQRNQNWKIWMSSDFPKKSKQLPRPRPNRELDMAKDAAKGELRRRAAERERRANERSLRQLIEREQERETQRITGKDKYGVQRGKRTKKHPRGRGI